MTVIEQLLAGEPPIAIVSFDDPQVDNGPDQFTVAVGGARP